MNIVEDYYVRLSTVAADDETRRCFPWDIFVARKSFVRARQRCASSDGMTTSELSDGRLHEGVKLRGTELDCYCTRSPVATKNVFSQFQFVGRSAELCRTVVRTSVEDEHNSQ